MLSINIVNQMSVDELRSYALRIGEEGVLLHEVVCEQSDLIEILKKLICVNIDNVNDCTEKQRAVSADLRRIESDLVTKYSCKTNGGV